jgi:hypothetical protein
VTTAVKYLPAHGTQYRYRGSRTGAWPGCRCTKCTLAHNRAQKGRALAHLAGQPPLYPAEPLVAHIKELASSGMSHALIARRANVAAATISYLTRGLTKSCQRDKALRILAVKPNDFDELAERPSLGSRRRVQALYAIGHNPITIAAAAELDDSTVSHLANGRHDTTDGRTAAAIRQAYQRLASTPGTSRKAKHRAGSLGWRDPQWWEDYGRIDDPNFDPDKADAAIGFRERAKLRREEIIHLAWCGHEPEQILDRLDNEVSISTVRQIVQEWRTGQKRDRKQVAA